MALNRPWMAVDEHWKFINSTPSFLSFFLLERISWYQEGRGSRRLINWLLGKTIECIFNGKKGGELFLRRNIKTAPGDECTCWHELTSLLWSRELVSRSESVVILLIVGFSLSPGKDGLQGCCFFKKVFVFVFFHASTEYVPKAISTKSNIKACRWHHVRRVFDNFYQRMLNSVIQRLWFHRPLLKFHSYITRYITSLKVKTDFVHTAQVFTGATTVSLTGHFYMDVRPVLLYFSVRLHWVLCSN